MEGYCVYGTSVPLCSMNNKQGQVYSKLQASFTVHVLYIYTVSISWFDVIDDQIPTSAIFSISQPKKTR